MEARRKSGRAETDSTEPFWLGSDCAPILGWEPRVLGEMTKCQSDLGDGMRDRSVPMESMNLVKALVRRIPEAAKQRITPNEGGYPRCTSR